MRIEDLETVQTIIQRIREIERLPERFAPETSSAPAAKSSPEFDSILQTERERVSPPKETYLETYDWNGSRNSRGELKGVEPTLAEIIRKESEKNRLDPALVQSVIKAESGFKADAVSPKGAVGLMQLMPSTADLLGVDDPSDPAENVAGGTKFLSDLLHKYKNLDHALAAYNAGPGAVDRYGGIPPYKETQKYVEKVKRFYKQSQ
ncbi:lytic transglycosylase domain-containing protein [Leptospira ellisii]|uniref:Lytic transglycosylase n=1 Tax=Leptospira ellisii TaxID=2023197 RepID=A0A2N0BLV1_9LEPT|nr:lytic transglycosylase domain-containing protein [Leptospira ellisii]MDV6236341.1 lytic transglycosylase domain-containing protein [Leptospira ellisii]PJZ93303.1 lytic transglycosylase [Leptospira ellisii]PKA04983.1 lytic transglycosylase [Leptospira ellisii]